MRRAAYALVVVFFLLRFDLWQLDALDWWLGLPVGLAYHVIYCFLAIAVLALLVRVAWPSQLENLAETPADTEGRGAPR